MIRISTIGLRGLLLLALVGTMGCGSGEKPAGTVSGTVTLAGNPLLTGDVNFSGKDGSAAIARIGEGGAFKVDGVVDTGEYTVFVTPTPPEPQMPGKKAAAPKKFDVPAKFRSASTSPVKVTVESGSNNLKIDLKD
ncbi:Uncharacterized protein OS=Planctomyces maris DSM 8797 GN=PM8797T_22398 PE=4 SV=1 [Tuwongella immobilis]|uniref:Carboxypeptidase regulatory-like domain-containing protein n=2 Tax=Tuwongella immobilis TaxID=692036 RepID=A0A6C2YU89_9BACT|nr:Uncharacterized protein OS=Planctomyces maris DSM 8797 GN=PM8797T_22398 PE=4 SV=1 [Tuwongella immobilis]VTS06312.1 Uncharacterized protein OS=Planctomyces maris DSM 8797 GN=PM8797T_22398 PE=4 SV=1 [Tuwongella immobilis]